jgi:serine palmitoyltransferase
MVTAGKFTKHVFNIGLTSGKTIHKFILDARSSSARWPSLSDACKPNIDFSSIKVSSVQSVLGSIVKFLSQLPNRYRIWWWNLLQSDPLHVLVETLLIAACIILVVLQRRADWRFSQERKKGAPTDKEIEDLLTDWKENGRMPLASSKEGTIGARSGLGGNKYLQVGNGLVVDKIEGSRLFLLPELSKEKNNGKIPKSVLNFATLDYIATSSSPILRKTALDALEHYGCGSCGPRGFYGTIDAHLEAEEVMSNFLGTEGAILYSDGASASTSTLAAFAKRGDLLIVDEGVNEALLVGVNLSRANVRYFRHNDMKDLRRILEKVRSQDVSLNRKATDQRRFLVVEGIYRNWGTLAPLKEIVTLKEEFHYRLIVDDSHGIGTLGKNGRGSLEHAGLKPMVHCEILTFSLENALGSVGGMTVGSEEVVDHQRLSGAGYCFSASAPPFLSKVCVASVKRLQGVLNEPAEGEEGSKIVETELSGPALLNRLRENISDLYATLTNSSHPHALKLRNRLSITSDPLSPLFYLRLADEEATGRTRAEQTLILDQIAHHCIVNGNVAVVSTGGHVKKYLQLVPEPSLRLVASASHDKEDVEVLVKALGEAVESVLVHNASEME